MSPFPQGLFPQQKTAPPGFEKSWSVFDRKEKTTQETAAGDTTLVLQKKTILASMANECTDRTSQRAEINNEARLHKVEAAAFGGPPSLWTPFWRNLSPPACEVRTLICHAS